VTEPSILREAEEIQAAIVTGPLFVIEGRGTNWRWRTCALLPKHEPGPGRKLLTRQVRGLVDYSPEDQVVTVRAGSRVFEIQRILAEHGQCIPLGSCGPHGLEYGSIGGAVAMNLPHTLEARFGSWRDWILGLRVVLADGTIAKCGSHAVKNVAGYDAHKLFVGSRGTLGVIVEVTLRTAPISAVESQNPTTLELDSSDFLATQRVLPSDFETARETITSAYLSDPASSTFWFGCGRDENPTRYPGDWLLRTMCGKRNLEITDPTQIRLMKRAKEIFDPTHKLNPGEMGIF